MPFVLNIEPTSVPPSTPERSPLQRYLTAAAAWDGSDCQSIPCGLLPAVRAVDEDPDEDEDVPDSEIIPPTEPLETTSDFDEDDFDDDFDDDFEEEFDEDEFGSEATPDDLEGGDEDPFEEDD
jgi:hypothetical protein